MPISPISCRTFWLPKLGNTEEEYEDAFGTGRFRFAVADGATETSFAGPWARLLARAYCRNHLSADRIRMSLPRLQRQWARSVQSKGALPWYAEEKLRAGAYATVLGLTLADKSWEAMAIGDSCLFQIRGNEVITSFPLASAGEFNNRPALMSTNSENWEREVEHVSNAHGSWQELDEFYLMTDAAACWFIGATENGLRPSESLDLITDVSEIQSLRESGAMRNDDVTVLRVCLS